MDTPLSSGQFDGSRFALPAPPSPAPLSAEQHKNKTDVVIIGAGPAGLFTACILKKADPSRDIKIFDGRERPTSFFGSFPIVLNKRGQAALEELGPDLIGKVWKLGRPLKRCNILSGKKTVASIRAYGLAIMRDQLVGLLLEVVDQLDIPIYWEHKMTGIDIDRKIAIFHLNHIASETNNECVLCESGTVSIPIISALVGADGNYSRVRRECEHTHHLMTSKEWEWGVQMRYILAPSPKDKDFPVCMNGSTHYVLGNKGYVCQQPDGSWSFSLSITEDSEDFMTSSDASPENIAKLKALCQSLAGGSFAKHLLTNDEIYASFFQHRVFGGTIVRCSTLAPTDWIALVGDSGHAVAPFVGEGVNSALESAKVLGITLLEHRSCKEYDSIRRIQAHALNEFAVRNRTIISGTPSEKCANTFSTIVLSIGKKMGLVKGVINDYMLGEKARERDPVPYTELIAMDRRQRKFLDPIGKFIFYAFGWWAS